jgi:hypothetical protein
MLRKGDIRRCPETNAELLIRWSEVRVLPPQPAAGVGGIASVIISSGGQIGAAPFSD